MAVSGGRRPPPQRGPQGQSLELPERAHRSLDALSELRAIFDGLYELAEPSPAPTTRALRKVSCDRVAPAFTLLQPAA